jgi:hypothetical protein
MPWNAEHQITSRNPTSGLVEVLDAIRSDQEERWQVSADYYRAALRDITIMRAAILAIFVMKVAEWCFAGN